RMVDLPPVDLATRDVRPVPTLVLGIGGTAGHVLSRLRRMIREQLGKNGSVPAVQFLLIDTDPRAISDASGDGGGLSSEETLNLPLRRPQHYRERAQQLLHWLSRRWLYNIPRSLRTEGLRPLGRLALADHARQTVQRVRRAMTQSVDAESIAASSRALGQQFRADALHVYVVASISGGTGGGMAIDIGYAVRSMLEKLGLKDTHVCGIMMHSTGGDPRHCELARVNAFSWLTEFNHFQQGDHAYPGDPSCGLPAHLGGVPPFDRTYLVHLGENLGGVEFDQATQSVAEYLQLSTLTPASSFLAACREAAKCQSETKPVGTATRLRSFGIYRRTAAPSEFCEHFASVVSRQVLSNWWPAEPASAGNRQSQATQDAMQLARRLQLDSAGMATNARALVDLQLGTDAATFLSVWFNKHGLAAEATEHARLEVVDRVFGPAEPTGSEDQKISLLGGSVAAIVEPLAEKLRGEVRRWISSRIDDTRERLAGARQFTNTSHDHFQQTQADLRRLHRAAIDKMLEVRRDILAAIPASGGVVRLTNYFRLRLDQVAILAAEHVVQLLVCDAKAVADEITALGREIDQIAATVARSANPACEAQASGRLASALHGRLRDIAAHVDSQVQAEYINQHGGLWKLIMQGGRPRAQLTAKLHELSRQAVHDALAGVNVLAEALGADCGGTNTQLHSGLALATPALLEFGGTRRTLAILPRDSAAQLNPTEFVHSLGAPATLMIGPNNSLTLCVEADQLALRHIALELVQRRRDRVEFADRVHCRTDIAWTPLVTGSGTSDSAVWSGNNARTTQSQQAMSKTVVM
ncbi:MAG: tubulin-like doman-containing protein, partial [Pirellulales bacterium]